MKITLLHYSAPPIVGGVESVLAHHARLMQRAGHNVNVLAGRGKLFNVHVPVRILSVLDSRHAEVMEVKASLDGGEIPESFDLLRERINLGLEKALNDCDVLIAHNVASLHKNLALTAALHAAYRKPSFPRLILWHHDFAWTTPRYRHEMHEGYPWDLLRARWEGAVHVVVSGVRRDELSGMTGIPLEDIRVVPNGVNRNAFYKLEEETIGIVERLQLGNADPLFLLPVRLTRRKNIELALRTLAVLRDTYPQAVLLVTGPEGPHNPANAIYKQSLLDLRDELGLQGAAHFMAEVTSKFLPDAVIADFYRLADALLFPSSEEGFGIPVIEAGFSHKPVFCADIPVLRELGGDDVDYFSPDAHPFEIASTIIARLSAESTQRWARRAKHGYTWDAIYDKHIVPLLKEVSS